MNNIEKATEIIRQASSIVVLTGAGASTESGIPDFRSTSGSVTAKKKFDYPVEVLLSHHFFLEHTDVFYDYYFNNLVYKDAKPNDCHKALSEMEALCHLKCIITQNIDGLHQEAGSSDVIELHGTTKRNFCMKCRKPFSLDDIAQSIGTIPLCDRCGGIIKPDVVLYEEPLNERELSRAILLTDHAEVLLVIGTSLVVYPAAGLLNYYRGDKLIIVNIGPTPFDDMAEVVIHESAGKTMRNMVSGLMQTKTNTSFAE